MSERYEIIIKNESGGGSGSPTGGAGGIGKDKEKHVYSVWNDPSKAMKKSVGYGLAAYATVRKVTNLIVNHQNSMVEVRTGSKEKQIRATNQYNLVTSYLDSAVAGAAAGFMTGGVAGAFAGTVLGLTKTLVSRQITIAQNTDRLNAEKALENVSRNMAAQRVTVSGSRYMNATQM